MAEGDLTLKQQRFADYYIELGNASEAARRAGYSEKTASEIGADNLRKPHIRAYIDQRLDELQSAKIADQREVLEYLTAVMRRQKPERAPVVLTRELVRWEEDEHGTMRKVSTKEQVGETVELPTRVADANKAAELLGKRYRLFDALENEQALEKLDGLLDEFRQAVGEDGREDGVNNAVD